MLCGTRAQGKKVFCRSASPTPAGLGRRSSPVIPFGEGHRATRWVGRGLLERRLGRRHRIIGVVVLEDRLGRLASRDPCGPRSRQGGQHKSPRASASVCPWRRGSAAWSNAAMRVGSSRWCDRGPNSGFKAGFKAVLGRPTLARALEEATVSAKVSSQTSHATATLVRGESLGAVGGETVQGFGSQHVEIPRNQPGREVSDTVHRYRAEGFVVPDRPLFSNDKFWYSLHDGALVHGSAANAGQHQRPHSSCGTCRPPFVSTTRWRPITRFIWPTAKTRRATSTRIHTCLGLI